MIEIVPFKFEHVDLIQGADEVFMRPTEMVKLEGPRAFSGFVGDKCLGCAGAAKIWTRRYHAWAYISVEAGPYMLQVVRAVRSFLRGLGNCRVEASVLVDFDKGHRFAHLVGMQRETALPMRNYLNGQAAHLYAWVNET